MYKYDIPHIEDIVFEGSKGIEKIINIFRNIKYNNKNCLMDIYDGVDEIIFEKNKNNFKLKSKNDIKYDIKFKNHLKSILPNDFIGKINMEVMYYNEIPDTMINNNGDILYTWYPNIIEYRTYKDGYFGKQISQSKIGLGIYDNKIKFIKSDNVFRMPSTIQQVIYELDGRYITYIKYTLRDYAEDIDNTINNNSVELFKDFISHIYNNNLKIHEDVNIDNFLKYHENKKFNDINSIGIILDLYVKIFAIKNFIISHSAKMYINKNKQDSVFHIYNNDLNFMGFIYGNNECMLINRYKFNER